jgi:hypothetical protein
LILSYNWYKPNSRNLFLQWVNFNSNYWCSNVLIFFVYACYVTLLLNHISGLKLVDQWLDKTCLNIKIEMTEVYIFFFQRTEGMKFLIIEFKRRKNFYISIWTLRLKPNSNFRHRKDNCFENVLELNFTQMITILWILKANKIFVKWIVI